MMSGPKSWKIVSGEVFAVVFETKSAALWELRKVCFWGGAIFFGGKVDGCNFEYG